MVKILVFDTETTDKPPQIPGANWEERQRFDRSLLESEEPWSQMIGSWPSIIQLSYILYDTDNPSDAKIFNKYIDIPEDVVISEGSIAVHHITRETILNAPPENRETIDNAINEFLRDIKQANVVIGHNVQFDRKMVLAELLRTSNPDPEKIHDIMDDNMFECTMEQTTPICNLKQKINYTDKKTGEPKFFYKVKSPKLSEAYNHFFGYPPLGESLHDALVDVVVCLRVYLKYNGLPDVCNLNETITRYIMAISPEGYTCPPIDETNINETIINEENIGGYRKTRRRKTRRRKSRRSRRSRKSLR